MSSPISAMIVCAARWPTPVISSSRSTAVNRKASTTVAVSLSTPIAVVVGGPSAVVRSPVAGGSAPPDPPRSPVWGSDSSMASMSCSMRALRAPILAVSASI